MAVFRSLLKIWCFSRYRKRNSSMVTTLIHSFFTVRLLSQHVITSEVSVIMWSMWIICPGKWIESLFISVRNVCRQWEWITIHSVFLFLLQTVSRHFRNIPVNEKETLTYFIYMVKSSKSRLDQKSEGSKQVEWGPWLAAARHARLNSAKRHYLWPADVSWL